MDLVFKGGHYLKEILILNSFFFEDKDPRFTRLKPGLALRLLSKGLFYVRAMAGACMLSLIMERPKVLDLIHEFNQGKFSITS